MTDRKIAYIDLSSGEIKSQTIPEEMRQLYIGGRGLDMYLLYNHVAPGTEPMSPQNVFIISAGLLTGCPVPGSGRTHAATKSPLTGLVGSTNMGGYFSPELRFAGFDHLLVKGKSNKPVYLWIKNGEIEIRDASHLWGKDCFETPSLIRKELGDEDIKVVCIGLAGENLVKFANIRTGLKDSGGRTGLGTVMGSKNLKAIAVKGTLDLPIKYPDKALEYYRKLQTQVLSSKAARAYGVEGTMTMYSTSNTSGFLRTKNFQLNRMDDLSLVPDIFLEKYSFGVQACYGCGLHCRHRWQIKDGPYKGWLGEGPEYNALGLFGNMLYNRSLEAVLVGQKLVDKYGMDMTEVGNLLAWAMELYEKGIIDDKFTDGLKLTWDDSAKILPVVIEQIARRQGFGQVLADGCLEAFKKIGRESEYYCIQAKGASWLLSDDRVAPALALNVCVATRGADHLRGRPAIDLYGLPRQLLAEVYGFPVSDDYSSYEGKGKMVWFTELIYELVDSLGICKFQTIFFSPHMPKFEEYSEAIYYITGMKISPQELKETAERCYTLERMFNYREKGITRKDDYPPERFFVEATPTGVSRARNKKLDRAKYNSMLDEYYTAHGWDKNGVPLPATIRRLGLDKEPSHLL